MLVLASHVLGLCGECQTAGPASRDAQPAWLAQLKSDRESSLRAINYTGGVFANPSLVWTQSAYIQPQMHPYDRYFYDEQAGKYTVDKFLDDLKERYGGVDAILMWPTYTNIGIDDRNQFDFFRVMPGGLEGVARVTAELKAAGVRVLWPYNPWDHGTRREPADDEHTLAALIKQVGADGFNGDTMGFVPQSFWTAAEEAGYPLAFEPEGGGSDAALNWATMGWGYWSYPTVPQVDRFKYLTRGKFMTNVCDRWSQNKTSNLQAAWFNGAGYESWENVWGTWNGIVPRDAEALRRVATMLRFFGGPGGLLQSTEWEPHTTDVITPGAFASRFPNGTHTLYTVVNRAGAPVAARLLVPEADARGSTSVEEAVDEAEGGASARWFDCYHGVELTPTAAPPAPPAPPPPPRGYDRFLGANCYAGHGGTEIDTAPLQGLSVAQCTAKCDDHASCECVTYDPSAAQCWRRAACSPAGFSAGGGKYDTYVNTARLRYYAYAGANCYAGHGAAVDIDDDQSSPHGLTATQCEARCDADAACECATFRPSDGTCWKRSGCAPAACDADDAYQALLSGARRAAAEANASHAPLWPAGAMAISLDLEAEGFGCALRVAGAPRSPLAGFLGTMAAMTKTPLQSLSKEWKYLPQSLVPIAPSPPAAAAPPGMVRVPAAANYKFVAAGIEIEGNDSQGVDVQFPWEDHPQREHSQLLNLSAFYIDKFPATNANYSAYLRATGYKPADASQWLRQWGGAAEPPTALADMPVTYISLAEARLYCAWAHGGARLPHTYEWQYAAQGTDGRQYPWGTKDDPTKYAKRTTGTTYLGPEPVDAHAPAGDSPFGVSDMVGNVWQYTSEFQDAHTRAVLLRGGSNYRPSGSGWYFPNQADLGTHNKYFLFDAAYERAATVGVRCVKDAA